MTKIFASSAPLALALALAVAAVGGATAKVSSSPAATVQRASVRCFFGANSDAQHSPVSGWTCAPEYRSASAR